MNENSNMNVNALMMALGKSFNLYSNTAATNNYTKNKDMNLILKDCLTSIICEKIMIISNKHTPVGVDGFVHQLIR